MPRRGKALEKYANSPVEVLVRKAREIAEQEIAQSHLFAASNNNDDDDDDNNIIGNIGSSINVGNKTSNISRSNNDPNEATDLDDTYSTPAFRRNELVLGRVIGRGGFCSVRELNEIRLASSSPKKKESAQRRPFRRLGSKDPLPPVPDDSMSTLMPSASRVNLQTTKAQSREVLARRVYHKRRSYVVKQVEAALLNTDRVAYLTGIIDLVMEVQFLAALRHPNILSLRGVSRDSGKTPSSSSNNNNATNRDFFCILDHLHETLPVRLNCWMHRKRATRGVTGLVFGSPKKKMKLWTDRLLVAYDIAKAMDYIHGCNVIYRDCKPDNIGFTVDGEYSCLLLRRKAKQEDPGSNSKVNYVLIFHFVPSLRNR
jgi:serine/threonine protein kinase